MTNWATDEFDVITGCVISYFVDFFVIHAFDGLIGSEAQIVFICFMDEIHGFLMADIFVEMSAHLIG